MLTDDHPTDHMKLRRINELMCSTKHWELEDEALELAYSMKSAKRRQSALKSIADAMQEPQTFG